MERRRRKKRLIERIEEGRGALIFLCSSRGTTRCLIKKGERKEKKIGEAQEDSNNLKTHTHTQRERIKENNWPAVSLLSHTAGEYRRMEEQGD